MPLWTLARRTLVCLALAVLGVGAAATAVSEPAAAAPFPPNVHGRTVCARAFVNGVGWQGWRCASRGGALYVGTTGLARQIEAVSVWTAGTGGVCLAGHVQRVGWTARQCAGERGQVTVGRRGLRLEAVRIAVRTGVCARGSVQGLGWQAWRCGIGGAAAVTGTTGQARRLEALRFSV